MVSPLRAVVVLVQQLIEDYNLTDPAVIAQFVSTVVVQQILIPACTVLVMIVSSYQLLETIYYWLYPLPPSARYRHAIELYSGGRNRLNNGNRINTSKIVSLYRNKKTTVSDTSRRLLRRIERRQKQDQIQAVREFEKLVVEDEYGPALLSLAVHRLYIESDPVEALGLLNLVSSNNSSFSGDGDGCDGGGRTAAPGEKNNRNRGDPATTHVKKQEKGTVEEDGGINATARNNMKSRQSFSASPSSLAGPLLPKSNRKNRRVGVQLTTATLHRDCTTLKLDAEALMVERNRNSNSSTTRDIGKDCNSINDENNKNKNKMTTMTGINSKMMIMDYLGIVV